MSPWLPLPTDSGNDADNVMSFIVDEELDDWVVQGLRSAGVGMVRIPSGSYAAGDEVLAEARRQDRVLLTHDRRYLDQRTIRRAENPNVVVLPRAPRRHLKWPLIHAIVTQCGPRHSSDRAIFAIRADGKFTIWMPDVYTRDVKPVYGRVTPGGTIEVWIEDLGY